MVLGSSSHVDKLRSGAAQGLMFCSLHSMEEAHTHTTLAKRDTKRSNMLKEAPVPSYLPLKVCCLTDRHEPALPRTEAMRGCGEPRASLTGRSRLCKSDTSMPELLQLFSPVRVAPIGCRPGLRKESRHPTPESPLELSKPMRSSPRNSNRIRLGFAFWDQREVQAAHRFDLFAQSGCGLAGGRAESENPSDHTPRACIPMVLT